MPRPTPRPDQIVSRLDRPARLGLGGALMAFLALGTSQVFAIPPFAPLDEPLHIAYAIEVAAGRLPDVRERVNLSKLHVRRIRGSMLQTAAAHPPLYYALVGPPLRWASEHGDLKPGIWIARGFTLLLGAAGLVFAALAIALIAPEHPALAVAAIALSALTPAFVNVCALVQNDALAFLATAALVHGVLLVVLHGANRKRLLLVAFWAAVATLTRFAALLVAAPAVFAVGLRLLAADGEPRQLRLRNATLWGLSACAFIAATSGWFYLRNYGRYGDLTAGKALFAALRRPVRESFPHQVLSLHVWQMLLSTLWYRFAGGVRLHGMPTPAGQLVVVGGLGLAVVPLVKSFTRVKLPSWRSPRMQAVGFLVTATLCVVLPIFEFYSRGGNVSARYYFPVLFVLMLAVALGYSSFTSAWPGACALGLTGLLSLWASNAYLARLLARAAPHVRSHGLATTAALAHARVPLPQLVTTACLLAFVIGMALVVASYVKLHRVVRPD